MENDPFADLPGYQGSMTLLDRDNARGLGRVESQDGVARCRTRAPRIACLCVPQADEC
jgi:hypothetical protein